jgi:hypothetical protein
MEAGNYHAGGISVSPLYTGVVFYAVRPGELTPWNFSAPRFREVAPRGGPEFQQVDPWKTGDSSTLTPEVVICYPYRIKHGTMAFHSITMNYLKQIHKLHQEDYDTKTIAATRALFERDERI